MAAGAKALYVLDLSGDSLPALATELEHKYPPVKVNNTSNTRCQRSPSLMLLIARR